ncbi:MAG: hypothetical protein ACK5P5_02450 [Pseudobdellovibrionaceae bacterium]
MKNKNYLHGLLSKRKTRRASFVSLLSLLMLCALSLILQACSGGQRSSSTSSQRSANTSNVGGPVNDNSGVGKICQNSDIGYIYDSSVSQGESGLNSNLGSSSNFRQRVADLVSVSLSADFLGEVSGVYGASTGVELRLKIRFSSSGQIVTGSSFVELTIYDSYVGQDDGTGQSIEPYVIYIESVKSGNFNSSTKQLQVTFSDQYGEITLRGRVQGEELQGTVQFVNYTSYDNSAPRSGTLGEFIVPACSVGK